VSLLNSLIQPHIYQTICQPIQTWATSINQSVPFTKIFEAKTKVPFQLTKPTNIPLLIRTIIYSEGYSRHPNSCLMVWCGCSGVSSLWRQKWSRGNRHRPDSRSSLCTQLLTEVFHLHRLALRRRSRILSYKKLRNWHSKYTAQYTRLRQRAVQNSGVSDIINTASRLHKTLA